MKKFIFVLIFLSVCRLVSAQSLSEVKNVLPDDTYTIVAHASNKPVEIKIMAGRAIDIVNIGPKKIYYGGADVSSATGIPLFPINVIRFYNEKHDFSIYLVSDGTDTPEYRIIVYESLL